jgi:hypothetical protein
MMHYGDRFMSRAALPVPQMQFEPGFLRLRIAGARARLDQVRADLARDHDLVARTESLLFHRLRGAYEKRDRLRLAVDYKKRLLSALTLNNQTLAQQVLADFQKASFHLADQYEYADAEVRAQTTGHARTRTPAAEPVLAGGIPTTTNCMRSSDHLEPETTQLRGALAALEEETLRVEREQDVLRDSSEYAFAKGADEDRELFEQTVQEQIVAAELESADCGAELERLDDLIRSFKVKT